MGVKLPAMSTKIMEWSRCFITRSACGDHERRWYAALVPYTALEAHREDRRPHVGGGAVAGVHQRDASRDRHEECDFVEPSAKAGPGRPTLLDSHRPPTIAGDPF